MTNIIFGHVNFSTATNRATVFLKANQPFYYLQTYFYERRIRSEIPCVTTAENTPFCPEFIEISPWRNDFYSLPASLLLRVFTVRTLGVNIHPLLEFDTNILLMAPINFVSYEVSCNKRNSWEKLFLGSTLFYPTWKVLFRVHRFF